MPHWTNRLLLPALVAAGVLLTRALEANGNPALPAGGVAQVTISGGYTLATAPQTCGVTIFEDGRVEHFVVWRDGRQERTPIARLPKDRVQAVRKQVAGLGVSSLVKVSPQAAVAADAPEKVYLARNRHGAQIELQGEHGLVRLGRQDGATTIVPDVLDGLERLAHL